MRIYKFGGASVKDADGVKNLITILNYLGGLRSTCTYVGAKIKHLPKCCTFVRVNNQINNIYK